MPSSASDTIDEALSELERLARLLRKGSSTQVRSSEERGLAKATALAWFNKHGPTLATLSDEDLCAEANEYYRQILDASDRSSTRARYLATTKELRQALIQLRSESVAVRAARVPTTDHPPSFSPLVSDTRMQRILESRWAECSSCMSAAAPLSATVMMGGLLEALLLARVNHEQDQSTIYKAGAAPRNERGQTRSLRDWTLKNYIDVGHELGWISVSAKEVGEVLRDYRNYVHPFKQLSHGIELKMDDATLLWEVSKAITRQVIGSV